MANFVFKYEQDASTTLATIIVNEKVCKSFGFSKSELFAIIAHEIGHIIYFFSDCKDPENKQAEEIFADHIAELLGLKNELKEVISKLITSDFFDYKTNNLLKIRKLMLVLILTSCLLLGLRFTIHLQCIKRRPYADNLHQFPSAARMARIRR